MLVVGKLRLQRSGLGESAPQRRRIADAVRHGVVGGLHQRDAAIRVSRVVSAFNRACEAAELLNPVSVSDCPGAIATGWVSTPAPSSEFPATEKNAGKFEELMFCESM